MSERRDTKKSRTYRRVPCDVDDYQIVGQLLRATESQLELPGVEHLRLGVIEARYQACRKSIRPSSSVKGRQERGRETDMARHLKQDAWTQFSMAEGAMS